MTTENMTEEEIEKEIESEEEEGGKPEKGERDEGKDEKEERSERKSRPSKRDRTTERVFGKLSSIEKALEHIPGLAERLERLEKAQGEAAKRGDPKPKLSDYETAEEFENAYDEWRDRNPKGEKKEEKHSEKEKNAPLNNDPKRIAEALGINLDVYEDFLSDVDDAREEFEDYDEVMEAGKATLAANPKLSKALIEWEKVDDASGPVLTYHLLKDREGRKEFKRIAALTTNRERVKALEALAESLKDSDDSEDSPEKKRDERKPFRPVEGKRPPHSKVKDESTMSAEDFFAEEEKRAGYRR